MGTRMYEWTVWTSGDVRSTLWTSASSCSDLLPCMLQDQSTMSEQTAVASTAQDYGKLVFLDKEGVKAQEYPITKPVVVLGRCSNFQYLSYRNNNPLPNAPSGAAAVTPLRAAALQGQDLRHSHHPARGVTPPCAAGSGRRWQHLAVKPGTGACQRQWQARHTASGALCRRSH